MAVYEEHPFGKEVITAFYKKGGTVLYGTSGGRIFHYDRSRHHFELLYRHRGDGDPAVTSLVQGPEGVLWFSADRSYKLTPDRQIQVSASSCVEESGGCILVKYQGYAFYFTNSGLIPVRGGEAIASRFNRGFRQPEVDVYIAAREDQRGVLWVITSWAKGTRLYGYDKDGTLLWNVYHDQKDSLRARNPQGPFMDLAIDRQGRIWIASWWQGLYRFDPETGKVKQYRFDARESLGLKSDAVRALHVDSRNQLWIGYHDRGISCLDIQTDQFVKIAGVDGASCDFPSLYITCIGEDRLGNIWIGAAAGLYRFDATRGCFHRYSKEDGLGHDTVFSMVEDERDRWWAFSANGSLDYYNRTLDKF